MKLPVSMLKRFVQTSLNPEELGDLLTMAGFELEGLEGEGENAVLDIKVMANRGDGLSALGLAREVLAKDEASTPTDLYERAKLGFPRGDESQPLGVPVRISTDACTRYACRAFDDVQNGDSPDWLQSMLTAAGQRPINLLVDLTNYVMLELGQPLHAFDLDLLEGGEIVVRQASAGEPLQTLNGVDHKLTAENMVIADRDRAVAIAGVMGGSETEVSASTTRMLLESAHFSNVSVRATRKALGLSTEASYRFERSVDPNGVVSALNRFAELYQEITGKSCRPGVTDVFPTAPQTPTLILRADRCRRLIGIPSITPAVIETSLTKLGFAVNATNANTFEVVVPAWRPDVRLEEDLIEEVGRVVGYEHIEELLPQGSTPRGGIFGLFGVIDTSKKTMLRCGLDQMVSHSLRAEHPLDFNPTRRVRVRNPHSPEMSCLRGSLLPGLSDAALRNGARDLRLFEIGKVFVQGDYQVDESPELAIMMTGNVRDPHWAQKQVTQCDFWTLKGIIIELGKLLKDGVTFDWPRLPDHRFHPTRQAGVLVDNGRLWVGTMGQIHPDLAEEIGLPTETYMAEIDLLVFFQNPDHDIVSKAISRNPSVRRDIAVVVSKETPYRDLENAINEACGPVLERQWLFDVYEGAGIPSGSHSLAIAMTYRKFNENFTDEEANAIRDKVVENLQALGAQLR